MSVSFCHLHDSRRFAGWNHAPHCAPANLSLQDVIINDPVEAVDILRSEFVSKTQCME